MLVTNTNTTMAAVIITADIAYETPRLLEIISTANLPKS